MPDRAGIAGHFSEFLLCGFTPLYPPSFTHATLIDGFSIISRRGWAYYAPF